MATINSDKPWEHPQRGDWNKVLQFMVSQIQAGKTRDQVIEETATFIDDNGLKSDKGNLDRYYPWLSREVKNQE